MSNVSQSASQADRQFEDGRMPSEVIWQDVKMEGILHLGMLRWKWAFLVFAIPVIGILYFGFKPAGSLTVCAHSYTAGSLFMPDRYEGVGFASYGWFDAPEICSASDLNKSLSHLRMQNLPGLLVFVAIAVALVLLAIGVAWCVAYMAGSASTWLECNEPMKDYFAGEREEDCRRPLSSDGDDARMELAAYAVEYVLAPDGGEHVKDGPVADDFVRMVRSGAATWQGRIYLLFQDLWLDHDSMTVRHLFDRSSSESRLAGWNHRTVRRPQPQRERGASVSVVANENEAVPAVADAGGSSSSMPSAASSPAPPVALSSVPLPPMSTASVAPVPSQEFPHGADSHVGSVSFPERPSKAVDSASIPLPQTMASPGSPASSAPPISSAVPMSSGRCPGCGADMPLGAKFCGYCGAAL